MYEWCPPRRQRVAGAVVRMREDNARHVSARSEGGRRSGTLEHHLRALHSSWGQGLAKRGRTGLRGQCHRKDSPKLTNVIIVLGI